ncbi:sugar phosphate isomerase/epimerase family protein [Streptosporangium lutulentum]|uniref:D-psicose/D-tagatose/L-ribulose 3-epimerase n=1 Tax=Streptosporangium lutulentum TaxID=1461250 RepID=A0ABT9QGC0_9ACTN|nr:sugar phosphate isomerase/epimerase family protein [Streptosporangium lutulentum]MDP9845420.1 D-psicose/D-tagatose/L-ribulose 3-epimerase [Streptosporangium lutulentum]
MFSVGVNTWVWVSPLTGEDLVRLAPRVAAWGFDVIELPVERVDDWDPRWAAGLLEELGLKASVVLVMPPGRELVAADAETVRSTQEYLRRCVDAAVAVGSPVIGGPAYASVGRTWRMSDEERRACYAELRKNLTPVGEYAAERGVTVAVEPLNRYETSLINTVEQAVEAVGGIPGVGLALDVYHMNIEERDPAAAVRRAGELVAHVQVCANDRGAPGADHLDWPALVGALRAVDYRGPLCIESFTAHNRSIATAASIWRPLAASQDLLATDGLAFLRGLRDLPATTPAE